MACRLLMGRMGWRCYQLQPQPQLLLPQPKRSSQPQPLLFQPPPMISSRMMIHHMLSQLLSQPQPLLPQPPMTSSRMMIHHQLFPFQLFHISFNASLINKRDALFYDIVRRIDFLCAWRRAKGLSLLPLKKRHSRGIISRTEIIWRNAI